MASENDTGELDLRGYLAVVRRRKILIVVAVLLVVASSLAASSLQTPVYQASAEVLLQARTSEQIFSPAAVAPATRVKTEIAVMQSRSVEKAVAKELGREATVAVTPMEGTDVVVVTAESTAPAEAARTANVYAETYIATRRQQLIDDLLAAGEQVKAKVDEIDRQIGEDDAARQPGLQTRRESYAEQLDQLQLARNLTETGGAQIVSQADQPTSPVRPTPLRNAAVALVVGLMLGVALAFLREYLDDTVKTKDDLQRATEGLTVLGLIPTVTAWKDRQTPQVVSDTHPKSATAEAYRSLRTSVQFIGLERPVKVIQLTSPNATEGKTTTLANLAVALASAGQRVIVVCCDLRRPRIHEFFGLDNTIGFTSVLLGDMPLSAALQNVPGHGRLALLASGPPPPNPSELLAARRTAEVLAALRSECDVVLVDSPPVLPVTDAIVLSRLVDATILVGTARRTTRKEYRRSVELLQQVDAPLVGTVLNGVDAEGIYGYGSEYGYGYATLDDADRAQGVLVGSNGHGTNGARSNGAGVSKRSAGKGFFASASRSRPSSGPGKRPSRR